MRLAGASGWQIWLLLAGFVVWTGAFVGLYALQAVGCRFDWGAVALGPTDLHRALLIVGFILTMAAQGGVVVALRATMPGPEPSPFMARVGLWASIAALVASCLIYAPVLFASTCI